MEPSSPNRARPQSNPTPTARPNTENPELAEFFLQPAEQPRERNIVSPPSDPIEELLLFSLGEEQFALPIAILREIVMPPPLSEVPRAKKTVLGVTMIRGEVVPVLDPRLRLRLSEREFPSPQTRVVIVDVGEGPLGLWVDRVLQVVRVRSSALEDPPPGVAGEGDAVVRIGRLGQKIYGVLDMGLLLLDELGSGG